MTVGDKKHVSVSRPVYSYLVIHNSQVGCVVNFRAEDQAYDELPKVNLSKP